MFAPKALVALLVAVTSIVSAAPAPADQSTTFKLSDGNPVTKKDGCILQVSSKHGSGVDTVIVLDGFKNCEDLDTKVYGPAGNGTAGVDFSLSPPGAFFIQTDYLAQCDIIDNGCTAAY